MRRGNLTWFVGTLLLCFNSLALAGNVSATKHNLSAVGVGTIKSATETKVCVFCHTPHLASPDTPLWNHELPSGETYTPYTSSTIVSVPGQPNGSSKLCLSCHDGTIALGSVLNMPGRDRWEGNFGNETGVIEGLEAPMPGSSPALLGTDLRDDHPVSFLYNTDLSDQNSELHPPSTLMSGKVKPDNLGYLQCTSCHDPHTDVNPKFLRLASTDASGYGAQLCRTCHNKLYWSTVTNQPHRESLAQWNGGGTNPWFQDGHNAVNNADSTPKANACFSCHQPHNGGGATKLLARDGEQEVCLACHNGNVASKNIDASISKAFAHPTKITDGRHNGERDEISGMVREDQANLDADNRHAECPDCHNPHAVSAGVSPDQTDLGGTSNLAANVLKGVWGVEPTWPGNWQELDQNADYTEVDDVQYQYQLCMKCHSSYAFDTNPPLEPAGTPGYTTLTDQAKEFNPNNKSHHAIVEPGKNDFIYTNVEFGRTRDYSGSLIGGLTPGSTLSCTNCHSDPDADIGGPKGPHGSEYWPILRAPWDATTGEDGTSHHLCFKCHKYEVYTYEAGQSASWIDPDVTGFSGCRDNLPAHIDGTLAMIQGGDCDQRSRGSWLQITQNLHSTHNLLKDAPCMTCHMAVPHGSDKRALLVYGKNPGYYGDWGWPDLGADPEPYNALARKKEWFPPFDKGMSHGGIPSRLDPDQVESGNWKRSYCHGYPGVGCNGVSATDPDDDPAFP